MSASRPRRILRASALTAGLALFSVGAMLASSPVAQAGEKEERFDLSVKGVSGADVGAAATAKVTVKPKGPWHVNMEFPTSLTLEVADGVKVDKEKMKVADAAHASEKGGLDFAVGLTPTRAGKHQVKGKIKFAICIESTCSRVVEEVTIPVEAAAKKGDAKK